MSYNAAPSCSFEGQLREAFKLTVVPLSPRYPSSSSFLTNWGSGDPCGSSWAGVGCSGTAVVSLDIGNHGVPWGRFLQGTLPTFIGQLTSLLYMDLHSNSLSGTLPSEIGQLSLVTFLQLNYNSLSGTIPSSVGKLTSLKAFNLLSNSMVGAVPTQIGLMTSLTDLQLQINSFSSTLPSELGRLSLLTLIALSVNKISGPLPSTLASMTSLINLSLDDNSLSGTIPPALAQLTAPYVLFYNNPCLYGPLVSFSAAGTAYYYSSPATSGTYGTALGSSGPPSGCPVYTNANDLAAMQAISSSWRVSACSAARIPWASRALHPDDADAPDLSGRR